MNARFYSCLLIAVSLMLLQACKPKLSVPEDDPVFKQGAVARITAELHKNSKDAALYYKRAEMLHELGKDTLCINDLKAAISLDSTKAAYYSAIGDIMFEHKDISGSVQWLKKAIELDPQDARAHMKVAKMFLYIKKYDDAFAELNIVLRHNVYDPEAYFLKGMVYKDMKDTGKAISSFLTSVQVRPDYKASVVQLGQMYAMKKDSLALKYYDNAFRLDTTDVFPIFAKGVFYQDLKQYEKAKAFYDNAIVHDSHYANAYFNKGWVLLQQDSLEKALRCYDLVTRFDPANAEAYYNRGLCNELLKRKTEAINDYKQALVFSANYQEAKDGLKRLGSK